VTITAGGPSIVVMRASKAVKGADGLMHVAIVGRVEDRSGAAVTDGTTVALSAPDGVIQPANPTTTHGTIEATLLYVRGTLPVVTADAGTTLGTLYLGPTPRGAGRQRFFAASAGRAAQKASVAQKAIPAVSEDLVLRNPLPVQAHVRVSMYTEDIAGSGKQTRTIFVPLSPHGSAVEHLSALTMGHPLVGLSVRSDTPVIATRVAQQVVAVRHGKTKLVILGSTTGVSTAHTAYRYILAKAHSVVDLFNPHTVSARVTLHIRAGWAYKTVTLTLPAYGSARTDVKTVLGVKMMRDHVTVAIDGATSIVAEIDPVAALSASPTTPPPYCIGVHGPLQTCAQHYVKP